jgi:hypothetical protein
MIVYGDPGREESVDSIVQALRAAIDEPDADCCDALRRILIQAGELEQAVSDMPGAIGTRESWRESLRAFRTATSWAARAFHYACVSRSGDGDGKPLAREAIERMRDAMQSISNLGPIQDRVWVQVPRGFAFHALYPEAYREAARRWAALHADFQDRAVLVVGIRSIGTTLSAVVAETLRAEGFRARRMTTRPKGSPFARRIELRRIRPAAWGLIVDEGPGPSGSSVLAVAQALRRAGIAHTSCLDLRDATFGGEQIPEALWSALPGGRDDALARTTHCGGGAWRSVHYEDRTEWPAVCRAFERTKFLCEGASGRRILFKFAGLATVPGTRASGAEVQFRRLERLARAGFTSAPCGTAHGFVATEWLEGRPLTTADAVTPSDAAEHLLRHIGRYLSFAAGPPLSLSAARGARARLETMLCENTREALGPDLANVALCLLRPIPLFDSAPRSGDGHLAPHEWIRTRDGRVLKTDAGGHDYDHTWTGQQPVLWDLAGAMLEWDLDEPQERILLEGFTAAGGHRWAPLALGAYRIAYAAHRVGQTRLGLDQETEADERARLRREHGRWRAVLSAMLGAVAPDLRIDRRRLRWSGEPRDGLRGRARPALLARDG